MQLSAFIHQNHKKIIREWVEFARTLRPWSKGMSDKDLEDHADELLTAIVEDMDSPQNAEQQSLKSKGKGKAGAGAALTAVGHKHASDRLDTGFKFDQLVSEYRALRASVIRLWAEAHGDKRGELTRFNETIDQTLAESAMRYTDLLNHTREQFLAILGHDLRNPLAAITTGAEILTRAESIDDKQARVASRILNSAGRMSRMISYLLDLARTRLGATIPLTRKRMNLAPVCQLVIAELEVVHPDSELRFESQGDISGEWDSDRLTQVLSNLVANALQYGVPPVSIVVRGQADDVVLQIHNEGPAIPEKALKNIFEPLVRQPTDNADKNTTGLGLGLYIAHEVVMAHGGTIGVISTEQEGTTFTVKLPRRLPGEKSKSHPDRSKDKEEQSDEEEPTAGRYRSHDRRQDDRRQASPQAPE